MSLIEIKSVTKAFVSNSKKTEAMIAINDLNLSIEEGEFVSIVGLSGCGKSATLSMIAGFSQPTLGTVLFKGSEIENPGPDRGVVFQDYSLLPWLSVEGNVSFAIKNSMKQAGIRLSKEEVRNRTIKALEAVGMKDAAKLRPNTLSGGMKQRVAIARLLAMDSEVFLMDEPFSALDEETRETLDKFLHQLWKDSSKTIIFVTHNIMEAVLISSRVVAFSPSPGRITGEWKIPRDIERNVNSRELMDIATEIRTHMFSNSR